MAAPDARERRVDADSVDDGADGHAGDDGEQRQQHGRAVFSDDGQQQAEHANRGNLHDHVDDFVADFSASVEEADELLRALAADLDDADADEQREDDGRQDVGFRHRGNRVRRNHRDEDLHDGRRFLDLDGRVRRQAHADAWMQESCDAEADEDGDGRRDEVDGDGLDADAAELVRVADARHADNQRREDDRHDHHLDEVDEHRADRRDPPFDERHGIRTQDESEDDGQHERDEDFERQVHRSHSFCIEFMICIHYKVSFFFQQGL